mmetsp:Transcript_2769/g.10981  ORF Transcript_2769/g.10981 Transcript_2769/m.10981 type:complete len:272 (+) Transcript_2769:1477-2292(+)
MQNALSVLDHRGGVRGEVKLHVLLELGPFRRARTVFARRDFRRLETLRGERGVRGAVELGLDDAHQQRRAALGGDELARVVHGLEDERERALELPHHLHHELAERDTLRLELVEQVLGQLGNDLGVRVGLEREPLALEHLFQRLMVGDDPVVHHQELVALVRGVRVAVPRRGRAVRRPARVPDPAVVLEVHVGVEVLLRHQLGEPVDLADLANHDRVELIGARAAVHGDAGAVIPAVLQPTQTVQKLLDHHALLRRGAVVAVREDAAHRDV